MGDIDSEQTSVEHDATRGHVLVIDDEPGLAKVVALFLESAGYSSAVETDPQRALDLCLQAPDRFDAVFVDQNMPGLNGVALIGALRAQGIDMPAVLSSGGAGPDDMEALSTGGEVRYLRKPFKRVDVLAIVDELFGLKSG